MSEWYGIGLLTAVSILTGVGHVCFKLTAMLQLPLKQKLFTWKFIVGTGCFLLGPVLAILASRFVPFSLLYGMTALNFVFILFFSRSFLSESIDARKVIGVACIIAGLGVIALSKS
jgi:drug/metabolite transporter (DMT)-like permease